MNAKERAELHEDMEAARDDIERVRVEELSEDRIIHPANEDEVYKKVRRSELYHGFLDFTKITLLIVILTILTVTALANRKTGREIHSCVTPGESCYQRGQKRTGEAIALLQRYNKTIVIASITCAKQFPTPIPKDQIPALVLCVNKHIVNARN